MGVPLGNNINNRADHILHVKLTMPKRSEQQMKELQALVDNWDREYQP